MMSQCSCLSPQNDQNAGDTCTGLSLSPSLCPPWCHFFTGRLETQSPSCTPLASWQSPAPWSPPPATLMCSGALCPASTPTRPMLMQATRVRVCCCHQVHSQAALNLCCSCAPQPPAHRESSEWHMFRLACQTPDDIGGAYRCCQVLKQPMLCPVRPWFCIRTTLTLTMPGSGTHRHGARHPHLAQTRHSGK